MAQTNSNSKPKPRRVRGTGTYVGDEFSFTPYEQGIPAQLNVKTCKGGKTYQTCGEKKPLKVAYLTCPADTADPWSEYISQLEHLGIKPQKPFKLPDRLRVVNEDGLECWVNQSKGVLTFTGTVDLNTMGRNWQAEALRLMQLLVRRMPGSEKFNKVLCNIIKKGGRQK